MKEGSLDAPTRHPIPWQDDAFYDEAALERELRRVFDICHGCRRCFNLCDSFPTLFDLIDDSPKESVDDLSASDFEKIVDGCTLCDMCFMTKCPYVPPHEWDLDFPHLMLRARSINYRKKNTSLADRELAKTDRNGQLGSFASGIANWALKDSNTPTRFLMEKTVGIDRRAHLPSFAAEPLTHTPQIPAPNPGAPGFGKKVAIYATCYGNFNDQTPGRAAMKTLAHNGVQLRIEHPECCAMPSFENGDLSAVAQAATRVADHFGAMIDDGWDIVTLTSSCALMLKFEWPLLHPSNDAVAKLAENTHDLSQYIVSLAKECGLVPIPEMAARIGVHFACHARAQNMGPKAMEMLKLIPSAQPFLTDRCSGHGGKWGIFKANFDKAMKIGRPAARNLLKENPDLLVSECPLAGPHLQQVIAASNPAKSRAKDVKRIGHPVEVLAQAYGL